MWLVRRILSKVEGHNESADEASYERHIPGSKGEPRVALREFDKVLPHCGSIREAILSCFTRSEARSSD